MEGVRLGLDLGWVVLSHFTGRNINLHSYNGYISTVPNLMVITVVDCILIVSGFNLLNENFYFQHNTQVPSDNIEDALKTGAEDQAAIGE